MDEQPPQQQLREADAVELGEEQRVWYASYGSNMCMKRLMCYIQGGSLASMSSKSHGHPGCKDKTPPRESRTFTANHELYFARKSRTWHSGGVCFIDTEPTTNDTATATLLRIYDISLDQFNDIVMQENSLREDLILDDAVYEALKTGGQGTLHQFPVSTWYNTIVCLGHVDGAPVLSFTGCHKQLVNPPHKSYVDVLCQGFQEMGKDLPFVKEYMLSRLRESAHRDVERAIEASFAMMAQQADAEEN